MRSSSNPRRWPGREGHAARMTTVAAAVIGAGVIGSVVSANAQGDAAQTAADAQSASTQAGISQQNKQFEAISSLLNPYVTAGTGALGQQQNLIGMNGAQPQQAAIDALQAGPQFQSMLAAGNNNILQNASATGGLRGGNTQAALGQFSPQLLSQLINDQYSKLGGLTSIGQNAAAGVGNAGMQTGNNVTNLLQQQGASQAGLALAQGRAGAGIANGIAGGIGSFAGMGGFGQFGGQYTSPNFFTGAYSNPAGSGSGVDPYGNLGGPNTAGDFSDVRLKKNIKRIGTTKGGAALYSWDWKTGGSGRGVLAQEMLISNPDVVSMDPSGLLKVNYDKVL